MNNSKPILAIETSGALCSAALYFSDDKYFSSSINLKQSHSEKLFEILEYLFKQADIKKKEIESVTVSIGPGSFTGLRIGLAAAKGIASASGVPIIAVPTFEALAYQLSFLVDKSSDIVIANKINKDEVFYAKFNISVNSYIFVEPLTILPIEKLHDLVGDCKLFGNAVSLIPGAVSSIEISSPSPEYAAKWALIFGKDKQIFNYDDLEPLYIKNFTIKKRQSE